MTVKQLNRYAEMIVACSGDQRYGGETASDDNILVGVLAGELKVVRPTARATANRVTHCCCLESNRRPC